MRLDGFPLGGPVPRAELVGRDALADDLARWLADGFRVVLTGPPRTGKSSVLAEVARRLQERGVAAYRADLTPLATLRDAATRIGAVCGLAPGAAGQAATPGDALAQAMQAPERAAEGAGSPLAVLLLDGCEHLERLGGLQVLLELRPVLQRQARTALLLAGRYGPGLARVAGSRGAPFALPLGLGPQEPETWRPHLRSRFRAARLPLGDGGLDRLVERTGGHPFDLMAVSRVLLRAMPDGVAVGAPEIDAAIEAAMALLSPLLRAEADALGPVQHGILHRLAAGRHLYREAGPPATIKRGMDTLTAAGMLRRSGRGAYAFTEPLLAACLREGP